MKIGFIITGIIILGLIAIGSFWAYLLFNNNTANINQNKPTVEISQTVGGAVAQDPNNPDQDTVGDMLADYQKLPVDSAPINYFTKLNNLIKGF